MFSNLRVPTSFPARLYLAKFRERPGIYWAGSSTASSWRYRFLTPAAFAVVAGLVPTALQAQVIDQYLDTTIPGYGTAPGVTVASREHPEIRPLRRAGGRIYAAFDDG